MEASTAAPTSSTDHDVAADAEEIPAGEPAPDVPPPAAIVNVGGRELVAAQTPALFLEDPSNPKKRLEVAARYATEIADVIKKQSLSVRIGRKDHVEIGGWQVAGTICKVAVDIVEFGPMRNPVTGEPHITEYEVHVKDWEWVTPEGGGKREKRHKADRTYTVRGWDWYAKAVAKLPDGTVVGSSSAIVRRTEDKWAKDDDTALLGMAQTRASSRAYRGALGWIIHLAGYSITPAEDMPGAREHQPGDGPGHSEPEADEKLKGQASAALRFLTGDDRASAAWVEIKKHAEGRMTRSVAKTIVTIGRACRERKNAAAAATAAPAQQARQAQDAAAEAPDPPPATRSSDVSDGERCAQLRCAPNAQPPRPHDDCPIHGIKF